jgi:hypothetical protein
METSCALCGKYIHRSEDPVKGKDGRIYHAHCYSRVKDKLEKDYEKKGLVSRVKRSFRQPEAYLSEQVDDEREIARSEISRDEIDSTVEYAKKEFPNSEYLSDLLSDLVSMGVFYPDDERINEICDALVEAFPGMEDNREDFLEVVSADKDREDFRADEAVGFVNYDLNEAKGNKMRIKLSELKKLIREESLLLETISGKSFCITGTLSRPRTEAWAAIEEAGGIVHRSVKRGTDFLVTGAAIGRSKIANAERLGVTVIDEKELWHMIKGGRRANENPKTWKGTSGRGHGEFRVDRRFEREPSYLDLAGLTSESRELMKEIYENGYDSSDIEAEINNTEYGKYLKSVVLVSSDLQNDHNLYRATFVVPKQELVEMYGSEDVKAFDRDFRIEFEVYNSEPSSFNRSVSLENKSTVNGNLIFEYIFRDFYNV